MRALTQIAHSQVYFGSNWDLLDQESSGDWKSSADQSLLFQTMSASNTFVSINHDTTSVAFTSAAGGSFAWTSQFAQQSLQADFDPALIMLFDKYGQGATTQSYFADGNGLSIGINGASTTAVQGTLSSAFGFADFLNASGDVRVARPVAVAETALGLDDQMAVVRVRQGGQNNDNLTFYRVDDLLGTIDGLQPGQGGYAGAAQARAYQLASGDTTLSGPGYGNFAQTMLLDVDANDLVAMYLTNNSTGNTYWAFSQANEQAGGQSVVHLWNYGLNTWGWEDIQGGGDRDYNDMVVQLDFTSAYNNGLLVN